MLGIGLEPMRLESALMAEARAVVSMAIDSLEAAPLRFANALEARKALDAAIAGALSGPSVVPPCTAEAGALRAAIKKDPGSR